MSSIIKVNTVQDTDGNNIINENANTITIGKSGDTVQVASGATLLGGGVDWQSTIVTGATHTVSANQGIWIDTSSNACTLTLPASPSVGDQVIFTDYARNWGTNAVTLSLNGSKFQGNTSPNPVYNTNGQSVDIVFSGTTKGWIPNSDDDVTFETPQTYDIEMLVIAGGGGGGGWYYGGGGGAGGYRTSTQGMSAGVALTVTVGDGGTAGGNGAKGTSGNNSSISGTGLTTITSAGGGGAGGDSPNKAGIDGGSGGGGAGYSSSAGDAGSGNTPSTSPSQGNDGGSSITGGVYGGGGGGGAGGEGADSSTDNGAAGGAGTASSITGSSVTRAGGGGGSGSNNGSAGGALGPGGAGGGGNGGRESPAVTGTAGTANTGSGGGGAASPGAQGGAGGKGVVILSMPDAKYSGTTTGSPTVATGVSGKTVLTFNGSGSYTT